MSDRQPRRRLMRFLSLERVWLIAAIAAAALGLVVAHLSGWGPR